MDLLFWSGGKDSYLALEFYRRKHNSSLKLLTTYDAPSDMVPHQNIALSHIREQAEELNLELISLPLPSACPNKTYLQKIQACLTRQPDQIKNVIFGDWHLEDIRRWRQVNFNAMGYDCQFPIWKKSLHELLPVLLLKAVEVTISSAKKEFEPYIRIGEPYNQQFIRQLPEEIDPMGENGEFHTKVSFISGDNLKLPGQPLR